MNPDLTGSQDRSHEDRGPSQLFLLRVWLDDEPGENDWHGRVQHPGTGEAHDFQSWVELRHIVRAMMAPKKSRSVA